MRKDRFQEAESIFQAAAELPAEDRDAMVADRCGHDAELCALVERLLRYHAGGMTGFLKPTVARGISLDEGAPEKSSRIGPYEILEPIGEGGMGTVFLAEQTTPIHRRVALKVIKLGMDTRQVVARFEMERQALAWMDHPGIAQVFDAGATPEGRPYFAMEYVEGIPVNTYCDVHELRISERLELFTQVCEAVQHAHQKGVIHRDLKPSNILVQEVDGRPVAKVIDFGVAKATAQDLDMETFFTAAGQLIGTPEYMSPEQADGAARNVDTRADVYSLGVILYELLAGLLPFDPEQMRRTGITGILKILRETDSPRPSTRLSSLGGPAGEIAGKRRTDPRRLIGRLKGDLDWIVMRALEKDCDRRYASPRELAQDIARHLSHDPVLAGPPSAIYRTRKYVRRHRVMLGFVAVAFLGITAALVESNRQQRKVAAALEVAEEERANAVLEAEKAAQVSRFLQEVLGATDPFGGGQALADQGEREFTKRLLDRAASSIEVDLADQPEVLAEVHDVLGTTYHGLTFREEARPHLEASLAIRKELHGNLHPDVATSLDHLGWLLHDTGDFQGARSSYMEALEIRQAVLGGRHSDTALTLARLGRLEFDNSQETGGVGGNIKGSIGRAEEFIRASLKIREETGDVMVFGISGCYRSLATIHMVRGEYEAAMSCAQRALEARLDLVGPDHYLVSWDLETLAEVHLAVGDPASAEHLLRRSLAIRAPFAGARPCARLKSTRLLGDCLASQGKYASADSIYAEDLVWRRKCLPQSRHALRVIPVALANSRRAKGDSAGAAIVVRDALVWARDQHGERSLEYAKLLRYLAQEYYPPGYDAAYLAHREELSIHQDLLGDERETVLSLVYAANSLSRVESRGPARFATADSLFGEALRMQEQLDDEWDPGRGLEWLLQHWGAALIAQGRAEEAEPLFLRSYENLLVKDPSGSLMRSILKSLINLYQERGDGERARDFEEELLALE